MMHASSTHQFQIARGFSLLPACAIGRPAGSSRRGRAAAFDHSQHQRLAHTERGKLVGMCAPTLGVAKTGRRFAGLGCHRRGFEFPAAREYDLLTDLAGRFGVRSFSQALSHIDGIGVGCSRYHFASKLQHEIAIEKASGDDTLEDLEGEARALASKIAAKKAALKATA